MEMFEVVLSRLRAANLKLNCNKCELFQRKVSFLGHIISGDGIEVQPEKSEAVRCWHKPNNLIELQFFLGLASYYRRFICGFSVVASPLYNLMRKNVRFHWDAEQQNAFNKLKTALTNAPVLASARSENTFDLDTDALVFGLEIVLSQKQNSQEKVLAYASRTLSVPKRVYSVTKQLLAVVFGLKHFRQYLIGLKFVIRSDHRAIQWIRRIFKSMAQAGRWLAIMVKFDFTVQHRAGSKHQNVDALSRRPVAEAKSHVVDTSCSDPESNNATVHAVRRPCATGEKKLRVFTQPYLSNG